MKYQGKLIKLKDVDVIGEITSEVAIEDSGFYKILVKWPDGHPKTFIHTADLTDEDQILDKDNNLAEATAI